MPLRNLLALPDRSQSPKRINGSTTLKSIQFNPKSRPSDVSDYRLSKGNRWFCNRFRLPMAPGTKGAHSIRKKCLALAVELSVVVSQYQLVITVIQIPFSFHLTLIHACLLLLALHHWCHWQVLSKEQTGCDKQCCIHHWAQTFHRSSGMPFHISNMILHLLLSIGIPEAVAGTLMHNSITF